MEHKYIESARKALSDANKYASALRKLPTSHDEFEDNWELFLVFSTRVYNKLQRGVSQNAPAFTWWQGILNTRSSDPLLKYVCAARNVDEHGLSPITQRIPPRSGFVMLFRPDSVELRRLSRPEGTQLVPIEDFKHGKPVTVPVPTEHLGKPIITGSPNCIADVADLVIKYLESIIDETEK